MPRIRSVKALGATLLVVMIQLAMIEPAMIEPAMIEPALAKAAARVPAALDPAAQDPAAQDIAAQDPATQDPPTDDPPASEKPAQPPQPNDHEPVDDDSGPVAGDETEPEGAIPTANANDDDGDESAAAADDAEAGSDSEAAPQQDPEPEAGDRGADAGASDQMPPPLIPDLSPGESLHGSQLTHVARFEVMQPTGIAIAETGRTFINFPLWSDSHLLAVVELMADGLIIPFPDAWSNAWREWRTPVPAEESFVCVQSVWADGRGGVWILDAGAPRMGAIIPGGPKLISVDLDSNDVVHAIDFGPDIAPQGSYLNDVRVDLERQFAYITESGLGSIIVVDLQHATARRVLADHPSTKAEPDMIIRIGGRAWRDSTGSTPQVHADGIALSHDGEWLYYHALTGRTLYRIPTAVLRDPASTADHVAAAVEPLAKTVVTDGMEIDAEGNVYHTALEYDAIVRYTPQGELQTIVRDYSIIWPDSLAFGPDGWLYFTTSQIHQMPRFNEGKSKRFDPYRVMKVSLVPPPPQPEPDVDETDSDGEVDGDWLIDDLLNDEPITDEEPADDESEAPSDDDRGDESPK